MHVFDNKPWWIALSIWVGSCGYANSSTEIENIVVEGRHINLVGEAISASQGVISQKEIAIRPILRTGEVLELVPGMVVTQHSGTGKANQYFLRGFNLDHGTDFSTFVDGMPINMRTHGHGQGYTDLNPIIPETAERIAYKKGPYYASVGDFSGAGSAEIKTATRFGSGLIKLTLGEDQYRRVVALDSVQATDGDWLYAFEANTYNGPWRIIDEDLEKFNLLLKHTRMLFDGQLSLSFMGYDNSWNSADQIPVRAVNSGLIDELGVIDDTVGGESSRYSLSAKWQRNSLQLSAYAIHYNLNLWSNFTYFLDNPIQGDQLEQVDDRWIYGGQASYRFEGELADMPMTNTFGTEFRYDTIDEVGLYKTTARRRLGPVSSDEVDELSAGLYWENELSWAEKLRTILGVRYDYFDFDIDSDITTNINDIGLNANNGSTDDDLVSLKGSITYTISREWEAYISAGQGYHSNDARGTTTQINPADGSAIASIDPLVKSQGYEVGVRGFWSDRLNMSVALWYLELNSELLFVGDAGNTEPNRKSERRGIELTGYYNLSTHWTLDLEYAYTDAEFADSSLEGDEIPGAIKQVLQAGISVEEVDDWFGSLRVRHFGKRPLVENGSIESDPTTVVNIKAGRKLGNWTITTDILNLLDSNDHDIDYFYKSRLPGEPTAGVGDIHYHVIEPRTIRVSLAYRY